MSSRWNAVSDWLNELSVSSLPPTGLSPQGTSLALHSALAALTPEAFARLQAMPGEPFQRARFIAAGTVFTAPLEWCAVLLGRGTAVTLKVPHAGELAPIAEQWAHMAARHGLPLTVTTQHGLADEELVVVMGSDQTVASITKMAAERPQGIPTLLAFGHRFSIAIVETNSGLADVARDAAYFDGRGCMSPVWVLAVDLQDAHEQLCAGMTLAQQQWPRGDVSDAEHAAIRSRRALATVVGRASHGEGWEVHELPSSHVRPLALPRCVALTHVANRSQAEALLRPHLEQLSTVGASVRLPLPATVRQCALGTMQTPPLERLHDGVDWLSATLKAGC